MQRSGLDISKHLPQAVPLAQMGRSAHQEARLERRNFLLT